LVIVENSDRTYLLSSDLLAAALRYRFFISLNIFTKSIANSVDTCYNSRNRPRD
jgi:hypothetical protein